MPLVLGLSGEEWQNHCELFGDIELFSDTYVYGTRSLRDSSSPCTIDTTNMQYM